MAANGRIEPGQPVGSAISARAWNRAQDAADLVLGVTPLRRGDAAFHSAGASNIALIQNNSGQDIKVAGILGINGLAIQPTLSNDMASIVTQPVLAGVSATETNHLNKFAITLEPIQSGRVGRAAVCGVVAFRLITRDWSHQFAVVKNGMSDRLQSASCGSLRVIAVSSASQDGWSWALGAM